MAKGFFESAWDSLLGLLGLSDPPPPPKQECKQKPKHWVGVRLRYKDDKTDVPAADGMILLGDAKLDPGPLTAGKMEDHEIEAGSYEVTFNIDASEWQAE